MNLVGAGSNLRLIDWQCPAIGDICEDIYSFLSPAFQILGERAPLTDAQVRDFWDALARPDLEERYDLLRPAYAWRFAGYCAWRADVLEDAAICARYRRALAEELSYMGQSGMIVETTIHSFSLWHHFAHKPDFDAIAFAELARSMGFQGISLSLNNANYRHLGGREH